MLSWVGGYVIMLSVPLRCVFPDMGPFCGQPTHYVRELFGVKVREPVTGPFIGHEHNSVRGSSFGTRSVRERMKPLTTEKTNKFHFVRT